MPKWCVDHVVGGQPQLGGVAEVRAPSEVPARELARLTRSRPSELSRISTPLLYIKSLRTSGSRMERSLLRRVPQHTTGTLRRFDTSTLSGLAHYVESVVFHIITPPLWTYTLFFENVPFFSATFSCLD